MKLKAIKALSGFTYFDGEKMNVFNAGDTGELPEQAADYYITGGTAEDAGEDLTKLTKAQLVAMAEKLGVPVIAQGTKADIIAAIEAAQAETKAGGEDGDDEGDGGDGEGQAPA